MHGVTLVWLFGILVGYFAYRRGRHFWVWLFLSCLISPLPAAVAVSLMKEILQPCPYCFKNVRADAKRCRHCGHQLKPSTQKMSEL